MYYSTLVSGVLNTVPTGNMSSTRTEGPHTGTTESTMSNTEPRVKAVLAVQTSEMVGVLRVSRVLNP